MAAVRPAARRPRRRTWGRGLSRMGEGVFCVSGDFPHSQGGGREGPLCVSCDSGPSDSVLEEQREFLAGDIGPKLERRYDLSAMFSVSAHWGRPPIDRGGAHVPCGTGRRVCAPPQRRLG